MKEQFVRRRVNVRVVPNVGVMGLADAGETTNTERILLYIWVSKVDQVFDGITAGSSSQNRQHIINSMAATADFEKGASTDNFDIPGQLDFITAVERSLRVVDETVDLFGSQAMAGEGAVLGISPTPKASSPSPKASDGSISQLKEASSDAEPGESWLVLETPATRPLKRGPRVTAATDYKEKVGHGRRRWEGLYSSKHRDPPAQAVRFPVDFTGKPIQLFPRHSTCLIHRAIRSGRMLASGRAEQCHYLEPVLRPGT